MRGQICARGSIKKTAYCRYIVMNAKTESFSGATKNALCELAVKSVCCRRALYGGLLLYRLPQELDALLPLTARLEAEFAEGDKNMVSDTDELFVCDNCPRCFLRGAFLACGSVSDPQTGRYQLELALPDGESADFVARLLEGFDLSPARTFRGDKTVLYFRDNENITDFLNVVGAQKASYTFVNVKIKREFENDANRQANCDIANISRAVGAAQEQIEAIEGLRRLEKLDRLSPPLRETALLREENRDCTLTELAALHDPPITKSGVNHRLARIIALYKKEK